MQFSNSILISLLHNQNTNYIFTLNCDMMGKTFTHYIAFNSLTINNFKIILKQLFCKLQSCNYTIALIVTSSPL